MADDFVQINTVTQKPLGRALISAANQLRALRELVDQLMDAADHSNNGASFATMESIFGLPTGSGANMATLIGNLRDILNTNVDVTGANRLSRLDEFSGRLAGQ